MGTTRSLFCCIVLAFVLGTAWPATALCDTAPGQDADAVRSADIPDADIPSEEVQQLADSGHMPNDIALSLLRLQRRFGRMSDVQMLGGGLVLMGMLDSDEGRDALRQNIAGTNKALLASNAGIRFDTPPQPTGDRLFDRYAKAVWEQIDAMPYEDISCPGGLAEMDKWPLSYVGALPDSVLAQWEDDFGNDPRYWELRFSCAKGYGGKNPLAEGYSKPLDFLQHARDLGVASPNTLLVQYYQMFHDSTKNTGSPDYETYFVANPEEAKILDEAIAEGPDECWPWYSRAIYNYLTGDMEKAVSDLSRGNESSVNVYPLPFPSTFVADRAGGSAPAGNAVVSGAAFNLGLAHAPNFVLWKKFQRSSLASADKRSLATTMNSWQKFAANLAQSDRSLPLCALVGLVEITINRDFILDSHPELIAGEKSDVLLRLTGAKEYARKLILAQPPEYDVTSNSIVLGLVGGPRGMLLAAYLGRESEIRAANGYLSVFDDLRRVDFSSPTTPDCMLKYKAITRFEIRLRGWANAVAIRTKIAAQQLPGE